MIAAKMHADRAREDLKKAPKPPKKNHRGSIRKKDVAAGKERGDEQAEVFRAGRAAAMMFSDIAPGRGPISVNKTNRARSSVVAAVTKRVEMLHMTAISREISPFLVRTSVTAKGDRQNTYFQTLSSAGRGRTCFVMLYGRGGSQMRFLTQHGMCFVQIYLLLKI